ncbi:4-alpha-glucanotransferase [Paraflavisolibacter sp. H34]|uniref:4-alpha-glucanotransferase n=1 Tax=Huijunlia imazamoxiresistens TaxID=3127457 RepID=UPI0030196D11
MKISFYVRYHTQPGQSLQVRLTVQGPGGAQSEQVLPMEYLNETFWQVSVDVPGATVRIRYGYTLVDAEGDLIPDGEREREIELTERKGGELRLLDTWNDANAVENVFYTAPFQQVLLSGGGTGVPGRQEGSYTHIFKVKAPLLQPGEVLCLSGDGDALGRWQAAKALPMAREGSWWTVKADLSAADFPLQYKYGISNGEEQEHLRFEGYENRRLEGGASRETILVVHDSFARFPANTWRGTGVAVPVFSLRTAGSFGVGEFEDIKLLADWARQVGIRLIQILPVNDTTATHTWMDSYPYAAISAFALHPLYIHLQRVAGEQDAPLLEKYRGEQERLNRLPEVDYEGVMRCKWEALKALCAAQKDHCRQEEGFAAFFEANRHWLVPYAAFCCLRDHYGTADFSQWNGQGVYQQEAIERLGAPGSEHYDAIFLHYFIQYHLHLQLKEATEYAHRQGVIIKGDIPIGIYRHSCDAWVSPGLYNMDMQAGAPPDAFAVKGQNWGFPTYNWHRMEDDHFEWWRRRFGQMSNYFDAFRIDHILGFFRIWSVPLHAVEGILGHFVPCIPVHRVEFDQRGIWFDYDRYTRPFITDGVLHDTFGQAAAQVRAEFLDELSPGWYRLKEAFSTQRQVQEHFAGREQTPENETLQTGLFDLVSNVLLLEVEGSNGQEFHFRIDMQATSSFRDLHHDTQQKLKNLYVNYFFRRQDHFWKHEALKKLPALKGATNMLVCGEDLGMVPHCVPEVMQELGILSLEIQRMPKDVRRTFFHPADAPYLSVVTPSTHDMSTVRGWWEEDRAVTQAFFHRELGQEGEAPFFCEPWINRAVVQQHLHCPAMWSIFQLQDLFGTDGALRRENPHDERINVPANPKHYWRYRLHLALEDLLQAHEFNGSLKNEIRASGR